MEICGAIDFTRPDYPLFSRFRLSSRKMLDRGYYREAFSVLCEFRGAMLKPPLRKNLWELSWLFLGTFEGAFQGTKKYPKELIREQKGP